MDSSFSEFIRYAGAKVVRAAIRRLSICDNGTYEDFVDQLYVDIDEAIYQLQSTPELRQSDNEDRLSHDILFSLSRHGYHATHDTSSGGHVDMSVRLGSHCWIAEAKKDGGFDEALLQLTTRYVQTSGDYRHDHAGLLVYFVARANAYEALNRWQETLRNAGHHVAGCAKNALAFYTDHTLPGSGTTLHVRTMVVSLHRRPQDRAARETARRRVSAPTKD